MMPSKFRSLTRALVIGSLAFLAGIASATAGPNDAAELFRKGRAAMQEEDYATAAEKLRESHKLDPSPGTLLNLAICEEKLGELGQSWNHLQAVIAAVPADDPRRPIAEERATALKGRVPWLVLKLGEGVPSDAQVQVDGRSTETSEPIAVDPGSHTVVVTSSQGKASQTVSIAEGERKEIVLDNGQEGPAEETQKSAEEPGSPIGAYLLLGVGAVGVATGSYLWFELNKKQDLVDNNCDANKQCNERGLEAAEDGKSLTPIYTGAWIVGAVGIAAGTYLLLDAGEPAEAGTKVGAAPLPGGAAVGVSGRF